jgi:hypothetical protein
MKKAVIVLTLASIMTLKLAAQNPNSNPKPPSPPPTTLGASKGKYGISDAQLFDKYLLTIEGIGSSSKELLAEQTLKSYMMPPRKMANADNSATYALASALEYYVNLNNNYKDNLSPDYIKLNQPQGSIEDYLAFLATYGTVSAAILPFESPNLTPSVNAAIKYKIRNYLKLFNPTTRPQQKLYDLRKAVMRGNPVIVELNITNEFKNLKQARKWEAQLGDKTPAGKVYVVAVAYDEERKVVEILNSFGREWGNGGYIWIPYEDFGTLAAHGYVLMP